VRATIDHWAAPRLMYSMIDLNQEFDSVNVSCRVIVTETLKSQ